MIFGHLLTSSNYDDNVKKTTGGRNGYGAKLTNIFSTEFIIETADGKRLKKYKQVFENNMGKKSEPVITKCNKSENWTKVTFKPDLKKFNMTELENDVVALMKKRVYDIAGCLGKSVKVELNGKRVPIKSFNDYVDLYLSAANKSRTDPLPRMTEKVNDRWEVCVSLSDGQFQQVSFVNSIATIKGGTHVDYVTSQVTNYIVGIVNKKNKNANVKTHNVKNHLWVFVNALIDNPAFDSQTKETLTLRQSSFGSKCELSEDILKKVAKSGVVENLLSWATFKQSKELKKSDGVVTTEASNSAMDTDNNVAEGVKPKGRQGEKRKAPAAKEVEEDYYSSSDSSIILDASEKRRAARMRLETRRQTLKAISLDDDDDDVVAIGVSPEKKVRKMRSSPFNKKSSSVMSRLASKEVESSENAAGNSSSEKCEDVFAAKPRPQRVNRRAMTYVLSDSESESWLSDSESEFWLSDSESESGNE